VAAVLEEQMARPQQAVLVDQVVVVRVTAVLLEQLELPIQAEAVEAAVILHLDSQVVMVVLAWLSSLHHKRLHPQLDHLQSQLAAVEQSTHSLLLEQSPSKDKA
jgi:hypothetical protein